MGPRHWVPTRAQACSGLTTGLGVLLPHSACFLTGQQCAFCSEDISHEQLLKGVALGPGAPL